MKLEKIGVPVVRDTDCFMRIEVSLLTLFCSRRVGSNLRIQKLHNITDVTPALYISDNFGAIDARTRMRLANVVR